MTNIMLTIACTLCEGNMYTIFPSNFVDVQGSIPQFDLILSLSPIDIHHTQADCPLAEILLQSSLTYQLLSLIHQILYFPKGQVSLRSFQPTFIMPIVMACQKSPLFYAVLINTLFSSFWGLIVMGTLSGGHHQIQPQILQRV